MASPTGWTWVWVIFVSWWWLGKSGVLWFMVLQRVRLDWLTELNWTCCSFIRASLTWGSWNTQLHIISSIQFSHSVLSQSLQNHGLQHTRLPCPSPTSRAYSNSYPLNWWCHTTISSSLIPFSSFLQSFQAWGCFEISQFFISGGHSIVVSASTSVLPVNIHDSFPLKWTGLISLQSKGLSRVFNTTVQICFSLPLFSHKGFDLGHTWMV